MSPVLAMRLVSYRYAGADSPALAELDFEVNGGELIAVTGPVGAGSSTLLMVAGGYAPRLIGGELGGERLLAAERPAIVFATPWTQITGLCRSVFAEVAFGPASLGWPEPLVRSAARDALAWMGITHLAERDPAQLSGGEMQRVVVASALAMGPDLLLLDDPAAELDPLAANSLYELLGRLAGRGAAIMVATPDLDRARRVATRALRLETGRVVADGPAAQVLG